MDEKKVRNKGFAGLESMVSDVEIPKTSIPKHVRADEPETVSEPSSPRPVYMALHRLAVHQENGGPLESDLLRSSSG
jgi:hypothetical protein